MSTESSQRTRAILAYFVGGIGAMCLIGALVVYMQRIFQPAPVGVARAEERLRLWTDLRAQNADVLNNYAALKMENGIYRLPINQAMDLWATLNREGNAAGQAQLIQRLDASLKQATYE